MKVSTEKCGLCGKAHAHYSVKHDKQQRRYVVCGETNKKMYVQVANTPGDSFVSLGPTFGEGTVWTAESSCPKCIGRLTCDCVCHRDNVTMHVIACCGSCPDCGRPYRP